MTSDAFPKITTDMIDTDDLLLLSEGVAPLMPASVVREVEAAMAEYERTGVKPWFMVDEVVPVRQDDA